MTNIFGYTLQELESFCKENSIEKYRAKQIIKWLYQDQLEDFTAMTNLPLNLRTKLTELCVIDKPILKEQLVSKDKKTIKFLFMYSDGNTVETVLMRQSYGNSVCVSSQVGCGMNCTFCASAVNGLTRNLTVGELLAQVLYPKPDILFLDEPTNNLDIDTIGWLENQLQHHDGTMVVISHDRHFLNAVCTNILDVDFKKIREFSGTYDDWYIASTLIAKQQQIDVNKKQKEKEELEKFIARFSANASKAKQATSRQKQLDKLDIQAIEVSSRRDPSIIFRQKREVGKELLTVKNISKSYGDKVVLKDISFTLEKGDKIALIGPNGVGKTTLCEILVGNLQADSGEVLWGATIQNSYFPQNTTDIINGDMTLYDWLRGFDRDADIGEIRNCLGRMLFNGQEQEKKVDSCSGGEKHRMMLSKIMLEQGNFLLLDEPTNHLDLEAIIALGEGLHQYAGSVICVSHDRELLDAYANRIIEIQNDGTIIDFKGSYEEFMESKSA